MEVIILTYFTYCKDKNITALLDYTKGQSSPVNTTLILAHQVLIGNYTAGVKVANPTALLSLQKRYSEM